MGYAKWWNIFPVWTVYLFWCLAKTLTPTKRDVLKVCASLYDIGFISPITRIKTIFQLLEYIQWNWINLEWLFGRLQTNWNIESKAVCICATQRNNLINFVAWFLWQFLSGSLWYGLCSSWNNFGYNSENSAFKRVIHSAFGVTRMSFVEKVLRDVLVTLEGRVSVDSVYCCSVPKLHCTG